MARLAIVLFAAAKAMRCATMTETQQKPQKANVTGET
jgi:hypothetical protein